MILVSHLWKWRIYIFKFVEYYYFGLWTPIHVIHLHDFEAQDIEIILKFLYSGVITVEASRFEILLQVAKKLKIFGLSHVDNEEAALPDILKTDDENFAAKNDEILPNEVVTAEYISKAQEKEIINSELMVMEDGRVKCLRCDKIYRWVASTMNVL